MIEFSIGVSVVLLIFCLVMLFGRRKDPDPIDVEREPNAYSEGGAYLIEHEKPGSAMPYTVWPVNDKILSDNEVVGFTCATRAEAEDLCYVLETGKHPHNEAR